MNDKTISEKVKLQHALKTEDGDETEFRSDDISRMKRLAGINQRLDADKEDGVVNFDGIFTGVANGEIPVSEGEYTFLKSLSEGLYEGCDNPDCHCKNCPGEGKCACGATNESIEIDEYAKEVDESKDEEVDEATETEEVDEELVRIRELAGMAPQMAPQVTEYPGPEGDYGDLIHFTIDNEQVHEVIMAKFGEYIEHVEEGMTIPENLWGQVQELAANHGGEAIELGDMDYDDRMDGDHESALASVYGSNESEMFSRGSLSRSMIEMIVDEMNKGKESEEISEELSFDVDHVSAVVEFVKEACGKKHKKGMSEEETEEVNEDSESYLANRDAAIKERIANASNKEEIDETGDEEVDESHWWKEGANDSERLRQLAGLKAESFTEAVNDEEVDESKDEEVDEAKDEEIDEAKEWVKPWEKDEAEDDEKVDEATETEEVDEGLSRMMELSGITEKKS